MKRSLYYLLLFCVLALMLSSLPLTVQASNSEKKERDAWKNITAATLDLVSEFNVEYSDNVFRLTESQQTKQGENSLEDIDTHRFEDMDAISDYIFSPVVGFRYQADSPVHGKFRLDSSVGYHYYNENKERSYPDCEIKLENSIGENGILSLEGNFKFDFFKKNYLSGYNNTNGNGNISRDERLYASAIYDEYEGIVLYEHEFLNNKGAKISELNIEPFAGFSHRSYNSPFGNRDKDITLGGMGVSLEFFSKINLECIYQFEKVSSPNFRELLLYNEAIFLTDANGDGSLYPNAPLLTYIDRSANRHTVEMNASYELSKNVLLFVEYLERESTYSSENQLDIEHYHQKASRKRIRSGIEYGLLKFLTIELRHTRLSDDDEDGNYTENIYLLSLKAKTNLGSWNIF